MTGQYLIVPASSTTAIGDQMENLKMLNGYLVPKSIPNNADPLTVAQSALPGVTYATLKVSVQPASDVALPATQKPAEPTGGGGSGGGSGASPAAKPATKPETKKKTG
jgi:hypothetical protein